MNSFLRQITDKSGDNPYKESMQTYLNLVDEELNKLYANTDCVHNYVEYFEKVKEENRQFYRCVHHLCHFSTNKSSLIVRHIRRHLKQKPYVCPIDDCKQRFYQRCDLRCHLMRHFEDKPFKCNHQNCFKTYTTRKALSLHLKTHLPFGFRCKECHKMFATKWILSKHLKGQHNLSDQSISESLIEDKCKPKAVPTVPTVDPKVEPRVEWKSSPKKVSNVKSLTNRLIYSMDSINNNMKEELLSKDSIQSFSAQFGFEEVTQYVINNCGQPINRQTCAENQIQTTSDILSNRINPISNSEIKSNNENLLLKCVESVCSLVETYTFQSNDTKKFLFKCINCIFTSDTVQGIVEHVWGHISEGVTQSLRNKSL